MLLEKYSIQRQHQFLMLALGLMIVLTGMFIGNLDSEVERLNQAEHLILESKADMLMLRRNEKDFLARLEPSYLSKFENNFRLLQQKLTKLKSLLKQIDQSNPKEVEQLVLVLIQYQLYFKQIVEIKNELGFKQYSGLYGDLLQAASNAETQVDKLNNHQLMADIQRLFRNEKDFFIHLIPEGAETHLNSFKIFMQDIQSLKLDKITQVKLQTLMQAYQKLFTKIVNLKKEVGLTKDDGLRGKMRSAIVQTETVFKKLSDEKNRLIENQLKLDNQILHIMRLVFAAITIGLILFISLNIKKSLSAVMKHMDNIIKGKLDFSKRLKVGSESTEMGQLSKAFNLMSQKLQEASDAQAKNLWFKEGVNEVAEAIRGEKNREELSQSLMTVLASHLEFQVATIYLVDEEEFKLCGSFGLEQADRQLQTFVPGQGLGGQSVVERRPIVLQDIPQNFLNIDSSLVEAKPHSVLIYPVIYGDAVQAVFELAWLDCIPERAIELLDLADKAIAMAVIGCNQRQNLSTMLTESQAKTEELQAQQEELRVTNEELISKSEALAAQQEELRVTNEELVSKSRSLEKQQVELKKARQNTENKAQELEKASKYKSEFLANMSHELRTPLNSLLILSRSLEQNEEGNLTEDDVESASIIYESGKHLLGLINDVLDISKIEAGRMSVHLEPVNIKYLTDEMNSRFRHMAQEKALDFSIALTPPLPESFTCDQTKVNQVLTNLISNAIKFTEQGQVRLTIHRQPVSPNNLSAGHWIVFSVEDDGIGISADKQEGIFEAFKQVDSSTSRNYGGTGLGLSISMSYVKLLNGQIKLDSQPGKGSCFQVYLPEVAESREQAVPEPVSTRPVSEPLNLPPAGETEQKAENQIQPKHTAPPFNDDRADLEPQKSLILIIEDDPAFAKILFDACHQQECQAIVAIDGETGISLLQEYSVTGVILDYMLPGVSGEDILKYIKFTPTIRHLPVHVVSASDSLGDLKALGAAGQETKPVSQATISQIIQSLAGSELNNLQLLVVEDDVNAGRAIEKLLRKDVQKIVTVTSGSQALQALEKEPFDAIILDLTLPDMSGFELLEEARSDKKIELPPIIVYSGKDISDTDQTRLEPFTDNIIIKSERSPERLLDEVRLFAHKLKNNDKEESELKPDNGVQLERDEGFKGKTLLLVDDDMRNTFALAKVLRKRQLTVRLATSGDQALQMLDEFSDIDLVLMDIMMPGMDGYDAIKLIREKEKFKELPLIAVTANAMPGDKERCLDVGANDYMAKPVDINQLLTMIKLWL